jgi:hypothetical protein
MLDLSHNALSGPIPASLSQLALFGQGGSRGSLLPRVLDLRCRGAAGACG